MDSVVGNGLATLNGPIVAAKLAFGEIIGKGVGDV
jgi:hypothetical protein